MLSFFEPISLLTIVMAHHPLSTFGATMPEDSPTNDFWVAAQKLENRIELIEKNIGNILKAISELQNSIPGNVLDDGRNQETNNSPQYDGNFNCIGKCLSKDESCSSATLRNKSKDGVYLLKGPKPDLKPFYVYCHHENENEKAWTIIQRRQDGSVSFTRNWLDFKTGFGDLNGEYWIGLERIHQLTNSQPHELLVVLYKFDGSRHSAKFSEFVVDSEDEGYKLNVGGASGYGADWFVNQNNMKFSTTDKDNDKKDFTDCGKGSGWWHKGCYRSNLHARYPYGVTKSGLYDEAVLSWYHYEPIQKEFMAIRPK